MAEEAASAPVASSDGSSSGSVPVLVKVIAVLYYIGTVFGVLLAIGLVVGGSFLASLFGPLGAIAYLVAVIVLGLSVLGFFVGRGLWKGRNWARIVAIVLAGISILMWIISFFSDGFSIDLFSSIIQLAIGLYLLLSKSVKEAFH